MIRRFDEYLPVLDELISELNQEQKKKPQRCTCGIFLE